MGDKTPVQSTVTDGISQPSPILSGGVLFPYNSDLLAQYGFPVPDPDGPLDLGMPLEDWLFGDLDTCPLEGPETPLVKGDKPWTAEAFSHITELTPAILVAAEQFGIPPESVAASIASEKSRYGVGDGVQDSLAAALSSSDWAIDDALYPVNGGDGRGVGDKCANALNWDLGDANIKVKTALDLVRDEKSPAAALLRKQLGIDTSSVDVEAVADLLRTPQGEVLFTTAILANGKEKFTALNESSGGTLDFSADSEHEVASLVSYFKEGDQFLDRAQKGATPGCYHKVQPNEGGQEFLFNEQRLREVLGLDGEELPNQGLDCA